MRAASDASAQAARHATRACVCPGKSWSWESQFSTQVRRRYFAATDARSRAADCAACKFVQHKRGLRRLAPLC